MHLFRVLSSIRFHSLKPQNSAQVRKALLCYSPSITLLSPSHSHNSSSFSATLLHRTIPISPQFDHESEPESTNLENVEEKTKKKEKEKKPLDLFFKEAVGLSEKMEESESEMEEGERGKLKGKLRKLEREVRKLKENSKGKEILKKKDAKMARKPSKSLYALFTNKWVCDKSPEELEALKGEDRMNVKELSVDMVLLVRHLYNGGYFKDANFLPQGRFDVGFFENSYGREFIKFAAERFGKDNQEIAKWLSGSDLKKIALFGCPSLDKKRVFSAKRLRNFFRIQEDTVCRKCVLKESCKYVNQSVWKGDTNNLNLAVVMRVITPYALESTPSQLIVPDEIKASVSQILKEAVKLSRTTS
ncbi:uncharacterized protein LOC131151124 isoform X1 [Malania oleifera]|uniref:uncharacterized protein LOC131151124 isoform X1 n=1 Tax=Malania oleifera TaxID=397392 RepID=UPI0025AEBC81|nr:uncharacterized protein LOC131151124 isoform X1 [Malania oleifera]